MSADESDNRIFSAIGPALNARKYAAAALSAVPRGHGIVAERASHLIDWARGAAVVHLGGDNALNGADRLVDAILIQTKYCVSGSKCIAACFDSGGFRYMSSAGPMQIEVPKDLYADALKAMEVRIQRGQVPGVDDVRQAATIVRRGHLTYRQAVNLGRAGTIEGIAYDTATGAVTATHVMGLSAAAQFALGVWRGDRVIEAAKASIGAGVTSGGISFLTSIAANQIARTSIDKAMVPVSRRVVSLLGPEMTKAVAGAFGRSALRGAAAHSFVARVLRGNVVSAIATTCAVTTIDVWRVTRGTITIRDAGQSLAERSAATAAGTAGWIAGATQGAFVGTIVPVVGTGVGALIGGLIGSAASSQAASGAISRSFRRWLPSDRDRDDDYSAAAKAEIDHHLLDPLEADRLYAMVRTIDTRRRAAALQLISDAAATIAA